MLEINHVNNITTYQLLSIFLFSSNNETNGILLDSFIEGAILKDDYSFSKGLLGAGWLISYLASNNMIEIDVDEILYDVDDHIYKLTISAIANSDITLEDLLLLISYYQQRISNKSHRHNFYRSFTLNECLKLLVDKTITILNGNSLKLSPLKKSLTLLKFSYLMITCFSEAEIEVFFYKNMEYLINRYQQLKIKDISDQDIQSLYYLLLTSKQYVNPYWITCFQELLQSLKTSDKVIKQLAILVRSYSPEKENSVTITIPDSEEKFNLVFLLVSNLKSLRFKL